MPTNKKNKHKLKDFEKNINKEVNILQETACTEADTPWTGLDIMRVV